MPKEPPSRSVRKPRDAERTKRALLVAAIDLFSVHGYAEVGVRDIAAKAEINPALVTRYFGSKRGLFAAALDQVLPPDLFEQLDPAKLGEDLANAFTRDPAEHARALPMLLLASGDAGAREIALNAFKQKIVEPLRKLLGDDGKAERHAVRIIAVATGFFTFHRLLPLEPMSEPLSPGMRAWLARTFETILDEPD